MKKRNFFGESSEPMVYRYMKCLAFRLKCSDRSEFIQRFKGFVDGLSWADFIAPDEHTEFYKIVSSCSKSIIRHYRKGGKLT